MSHVLPLEKISHVQDTNALTIVPLNCEKVLVLVLWSNAVSYLCLLPIKSTFIFYVK